MFKIGDKVRCIKSHDGNTKIVGKLGKVINCDYDTFGIEFEDYIEGHACCFSGKDGHCWNFSKKSDCLELVKEEVKVENKFKVGQKYLVDTKLEVGESGNTIEITGVDGIWIAYKTVKSKRDGYEFHTSSFGNTSTFGENLKLLSKKQNKLIITNDGTTTTAVLRNGKTVLEKATAICCPTDEFSTYEGARIALARLFGEEPFPVTRDIEKADIKESTELAVGDRVRHFFHAMFGEGTVIFKDDDCLVEFDNCHDDLHDGHGKGKENHCWFTSSSNLIKIKTETPNSDLLPKTVKCDKYQIGDKVLIVSKWVGGCCQNLDGKMDKWLGKTMTIRVVDNDRGIYLMEEDSDDGYGGGWYWRNTCIVGKIVTEKPVVKADSNTIYVGDIIKIVDDSDGRFKIGELCVAAESRPVKMGCFVKHPLGTVDGKAFLCPSEFEVVKVKTVNRKPVKGDLVRIGEHRGYSFATKGDVVRVNKVFGDHFTVLGAEFNYGDGIKEWNFSFSEAVVLEEDCTPKYRKVDRPAKVGDKIRIVEPWLTNGRYKKNDVFTVSDDMSCCGAVKVEELGNFNIAHQEYVVLE